MDAFWRDLAGWNVGELWRDVVAMYAWPAWLLVLIPAPIGLLAAFSVAISYDLIGRGRGVVWGVVVLLRGGMAGVVVVLPVTVLAALFVGAVAFGRSVVVGATGGFALGAVGALAAVIAGFFGLEEEPWDRFVYSGGGPIRRFFADMGLDALWHRWPSW